MRPSLSLPMYTQGALWVSLAACLIGVLSVLVRQIAAELHPFEIAFFRNLGQLVLMVPWVLYAGLSRCVRIVPGRMRAGPRSALWRCCLGFG